MKKYLLLIPLMLFPYADIIGIAVCWLASVSGYSVLGILAVGIIDFIFSIFCCAAAVKSDAKTAAKMNLIVKLSHIPAYIFRFILGSLGIFASVWGVGFILYAVISDVLCIAVSGLFAAFCVRAAKKDGVVSGKASALYTLCSFIFCIDVAAAIALAVRTNKKVRENFYAVQTDKSF